MGSCEKQAYELVVDGVKLAYEIRRSRRARRVRLSVYLNGSIVVTLPWFTSRSVAERFVKEKASWLLSRREQFTRQPVPFIARGGKREYLAFKEAARGLVQRRLQYYNRLYNLSYSRVTIRNQQTRWGSCSKGGNLSFNYRIVHLPAEVADYVVVHELCHLAEFNHSKRFWALVGRSLPNYADLRKRLKGKGDGPGIV